tara:strand:- start:129 stop:1748 length:1620 start_codon:yes stop_codon:yes gene_type:complete
MGFKFNLEEFGLGFLDGASDYLDTKSAERAAARKQEKAQARQNLPLIGKRRALARQAADYGNQAKALGASEKQVAIALNSGFDGIQQFVTNLQKAADQRGMTSLSADDIDAITDMPELPDVNFSYDDMYRAVYGTVPTEAKSPDRSFLAKMVGAGNNDDLARDTFAQGLTVQQINDMAASDDYTKMAGFDNAYINYTQKPFMDDVEGIDFVEKYGKMKTDYLKLDAVIAKADEIDLKIAQKVEAKRSELGDDPEAETKIAQFEMSLKRQASKEILQGFTSTLDPVVAGYSNKYGNSFYTNPAVKGFLTNIYGSDWVSTQTKPKKVVDQNTGEVITVDKETGQEVVGTKERASDLTIDPDYNETIKVTPLDAYISEETVTVGGEEKVIVPFTEDQQERVKNYMDTYLLPHMDDRYSMEYTRDDWNNMTRTERDKAGLPTSAVGSWNFEFRDDLEKAIEPTKQEMNINGALGLYANPQEGAFYKIKVKGRLGAFKVSAEDLREIPIERIKNGSVMIDKIEGEEEGLQSKGSDWINRTLGVK